MTSQGLERPLRVLHVHTCYDKYCGLLYGARKELAARPFEEQMKVWARDAYSGIHMVTPYLPGCQGMLVMANCPQAQLMWLQEHGGTLPDPQHWQDEIVLRQVQHFQPDVLYLGDSIRHQAAFVASLPYRPSVIMGWRGADVPLGTDWTGFDAILSNLRPMLTLAESLGAKKGVMFAPGMPSWIAREVEHLPQEVDVVFAGSVYPKVHMRRLALLEAVAQAATRHGFSLELYLTCPEDLISPVMRPFVRPPVFGMDMHRALRRGKIVFDVSGTVGLRKPDGSYVVDLAQGDTGTMRLFEATGGGSLMIYNDMPGLSRIFEPGKEVATFRDEQDLENKILHYLAHPQEREALAAAGKARCLGEHNMKARAAQFVEIMHAALAAKREQEHG